MMKTGTRKILLLLFWLAVAIIVLLVRARRLGDDGITSGGIESQGKIINNADASAEARP